MEFLLPFQSRCAFQGWNCAEHFADKGPRTSLIAIKEHLGLHGNDYNLQNSATTKKHQNRTSREDMRPNMSFGWSGDLPADSATKMLHRSMIAKTKWGSLAIPVCFLGVNLCQDDIMPGWTKVWAWILWTWVKFDYRTKKSTNLVDL